MRDWRHAPFAGVVAVGDVPVAGDRADGVGKLFGGEAADLVGP